eukprot:scaffold60268_cov27-Tisochrysis_lutea.AAC.10
MIVHQLAQPGSLRRVQYKMAVHLCERGACREQWVRHDAPRKESACKDRPIRHRQRLWSTRGMASNKCVCYSAGVAERIDASSTTELGLVLSGTRRQAGELNAKVQHR